MSDIIIKITDRTETRRLRVPPNTKFATIQQRVSSRFGLAPIKLKYTDDEGDLITVDTDSELADAIAIARTTKPEKPVLLLTLEVTNHTMAKLATRNSHDQRLEAEPVARSPEGQTVAEQATVPQSQGALTAVPSSTIVKAEGDLPPMPPDACVEEEGGAVAQSAMTTLTTTADARPAEKDVPTATQTISPAEKSAPATTTTAGVLPLREDGSSEAAADIANRNMAANIAAIPESGAGPTQKHAGLKRKHDSAQLHKVSAFLVEKRGGHPSLPTLPPGWGSEMVDRATPYKGANSSNRKGAKSSDRMYSGPDKEGKQVSGVKTVKHAWLVYGGFATGESACQVLGRQLKEYKASVVAAVPPAAGAPDPSSENGVGSDPKDAVLCVAAVPLGANGARMDGAFGLHIEGMD